MPANFTFGQQLNARISDLMRGGVLPAQVESVVGGKIAVRVAANGRRLTNLDCVGGVGNLNKGDTVYLMQTKPNQYVALSPQQVQQTSNGSASNNDVNEAELYDILTGYALVNHSHPQKSGGGGLAAPTVPLAMPVTSASYGGTAGSPGAFVDHAHSLQVDPVTLSWTGGTLTVIGSSGGAPLSNAIPLIEGIAAPGTSASAARGDHVHPAYGGGASTSAGHEHAVARWNGAAGETAFNLPDYADQIMSMSVGGLEVDPADIDLSSDGDVITLSPALAAGSIVQASYILRSL